MNTKTLIDAVLNFTDNIGATDADNAVRRTRMLQYAQEVVDYVWAYADWPWAYRTSSTISVAATGIALLPADFGHFGYKGGIFNSSNGKLSIEEYDLAQFVYRFNRGNRDALEHFVRLGQDTTTSTGRQQMRFYATGGTVDCLYIATAPTLVDADSATTSLLQYVPSQWHNLVLLPGIITKTRTSKGDVRDFEKDFVRGLSLMHAKEMAGQTASQQLPMTRRMW